MLGVSDTRREELKGKSASDSQYREWLVKHWLETYYLASWEEVGGTLLLNEENAALEKVRRRIKPERGGCVVLIWQFLNIYQYSDDLQS